MSPLQKTDLTHATLKNRSSQTWAMSTKTTAAIRPLALDGLKILTQSLMGATSNFEEKKSKEGGRDQNKITWCSSKTSMRASDCRQKKRVPCTSLGSPAGFLNLRIWCWEAETHSLHDSKYSIFDYSTVQSHISRDEAKNKVPKRTPSPHTSPGTVSFVYSAFFIE